jgi:hypothetical protein
MSEPIGHYWADYGLFVAIDKYEPTPENFKALTLHATPTEAGYHVHVIQKCVQDWSDILTLLDMLQVKKAPAEVIKDLYEVVLQYNPFLRYEDWKKTQIAPPDYSQVEEDECCIVCQEPVLAHSGSAWVHRKVNKVRLPVHTGEPCWPTLDRIVRHIRRK